MVTDSAAPLKNQEKKRGTRIDKRLYTLREAAVYLGRGLHGVRDMVWNGELPVVRAGRKMWVDLSDLDRWIEDRKETYA